MTHATGRDVRHNGPVPVDAILSHIHNLETRKYGDNEVDPLHDAPISSQNIESQREFLRNGNLQSVQLVGKGYYYTLEDGRKMLSFAVPHRIQYQSGV